MIALCLKLGAVLLAATMSSAVAPEEDYFPGRSCQNLYKYDREDTSRRYTIFPVWWHEPISAYCNMEDGGGWMVIQRRKDASVNFDRSWSDYVEGFGDLKGEFWFGLEKLHLVTNVEKYELRIDITDVDGNEYYATYEFRIDGAENGYRLASLGNFGGTIGFDALSYQLHNKFSTHDKDLDEYAEYDCSEEHNAGWWFDRRSSMTGTGSFCTGHSAEACTMAPVAPGGPYDCVRCALTNLNGKYRSATRGTDMFWANLPGYDCVLRYVEMRIRAPPEAEPTSEARWGE